MWSAEEQLPEEAEPIAMSEREPASATPILDLTEPLPQPQVEGIRLRNVVALLTGIAAALVLPNLPVLAILLGYFTINLVVAVVHEFGHWLAGRSVGFRLTFLAIGPLWLKRDSGRWKLRWRRHLTGGLILMSIDRVRRVRRRLLIWVAGGPIASLTAGTAALISCRAEKIGGNPAIGLPMAGFAILSLLAGIQSLRRVRFGHYAGDGMLFRTLLRSYGGAKQQIAAHALYMLKNRGVDRSLWSRRWMAMAATPTEILTTTFHTDWLKYELTADPETAAQCLERCLAASGPLSPEEREENLDELFLECAIFMAWHRHDAHKAEVWFKRAAHPERTSAVTRRKAEVALDWAHGDFDKALAGVKQGYESIQQTTGARTGQAESWSREWRARIQRSQDEYRLMEALCR